MLKKKKKLKEYKATIFNLHILKGVYLLLTGKVLVSGE